MTSTTTRLALAAAALFCLSALGCMANRPPLTCPGKGGPTWTRVRSPHFVVETDLPVEKATDLAVDVETSRAALLAVMGAPRDDAATPVEVVLFDRSQDLDAIGSTLASGTFFWRLDGDVEIQPVIVMAGGLDYLTRTTLQHELVHEIVRRRTAQVPWWIDEGLAELYSTVRIDGGELVVGEPPEDVDFWERSYPVTDTHLPVSKLWIPVSYAPSFDDLLGVDRLTVQTGGAHSTYYAAAWKLMHALRGHTDARLAPRFKAMMEALMSGADGAAAFARAYKGILMSDIAESYQKLLEDHREYPRVLPFEPPKDIPTTASSMLDDEVHALWARIETSFAAPQLSPDEELARGLAETPGSPHLLYARASIHTRLPGGVEARRRDIADLLRAAPSDPRYLLLDLMMAMNDRDLAKGTPSAKARGDELVAKVEKMRPIAVTPAQLAYTSFVLLTLQRFKEADLLADKAVEAGPSCAVCFAIHAITLHVGGHPAEARAAGERAMALMLDSSARARFEELLAQLESAMKAGKAGIGQDTPAP